jgi:hypothetical protein
VALWWFFAVLVTLAALLLCTLVEIEWREWLK